MKRTRIHEMLFNSSESEDICCFRVQDKRSHYEPSVPGAAEVVELDDHDLYVPHFQRVSISGEDTSGVSKPKARVTTFKPLHFRVSSIYEYMTSTCSQSFLCIVPSDELNFAYNSFFFHLLSSIVLFITLFWNYFRIFVSIKGWKRGSNSFHIIILICQVLFNCFLPASRKFQNFLFLNAINKNLNVMNE